MRFFILTVSLLLVGLGLNAQNSWPNIKKESWQALVYKITADTAERYIHEGISTPETYLNQKPFAIWKKDSTLYQTLPVGNYVVLSVNNYKITAHYYCQSRLNIYPINNQHRVQIEVLDSVGLPAKQAAVWINKKRAQAINNSSSFLLKNKYPDEAIIKVTTPGDTLFMELTAKDDVEKRAFEQRWHNFFNYNKTGRMLAWPAKKIDNLFSGNHYYKRRKYKNKDINNGYMIFNKPMYKPNDTVRLKAYILNKKYKQINKPLDLFLNYYYNGNSVTKKMGQIKPQTPGAFVYEFVIGDSLKSDQTYYVHFQDKKENTYARSSFAIEDYLLDEVSSYEVKSVKDNYFRHDTLVFNATAKDANGLGLMDGKVSLYLLRNNVNAYYKDRMYIADTLWTSEKNLAVDDDTRFEIPGNHFPEADMEITVKAVFKNSNNEIQEKQTRIALAANQQMIQVEQADGYITATYWQNGKTQTIEGTVDNDKINAAAIKFPYKKKINPHVSYYSFMAKQGDSAIARQYQAVNNYYKPGFNHIQEKEIVGFGLHNPYNIAIHYTIFNGNKLVDYGVDTATKIVWKKKLKKNTIYKVEWNYVWAGHEQKGNDQVVVMNKLLQTEIVGAQTVFPGQKDTITINVKDYKGNPAKGVNLTAVSYNTQFGGKASVSEPPYLQQFKLKRRILFDNYELEDTDMTRHFLLGNHNKWVEKFRLDTMLYYQLLFPENGKRIIQTKVSEFLPQVAIHVVQKGVPQQIQLLYINRDLTWYNGVTDYAKYAFATMPGFVQFGFRLKESYIQLDSIYLQPYYKHDIVIDIDKLDGKFLVKEMPKTFTAEERQLLETRILRLDNSYTHRGGYLWQGNTVVQLNSNQSFVVGPFKSSPTIKFYKTGIFDLDLPFEPTYQYRLSEKIYRLEKKPLFPENSPASFINNPEPNWTLGDTLVPPPEINYTKPAVYTNSIYLETNDNYYNNKKGTGQFVVAALADSSFEYGILRSLADTDIVTRIKRYNILNYNNVTPGKYELVLRTYKGTYVVIENIEIKADGINYVNAKAVKFYKDNAFVEGLIKQQQEKRQAKLLLDLEKYEKQKRVEAQPGAVAMPEGKASISGQVKDNKGGSVITNVSVSFKGYTKSAFTDGGGNYSLNNLKSGNYTIVFTAIGYETFTKDVFLQDGALVVINAALKLSENLMEEVVVVGYGVQRKKEMTASIAIVKTQEFSSALQGRVAGVQINGNAGASESIRIRGLSSLNADNGALYVVDGVIVDKLPDGIAPENISILKDAAAISLYGARAANGVIIITTKGFTGPVIRDQFKDYAFWQPNLVTNKKGQVSFAVTYPDNITSWQTFVVGVDKKKRITKTSTIVKAFKPLLAQLSVPQFLVEGDSSVFTGKLINYTDEKTTASISTKIGSQTQTQQVVLPGKESVIVPFAVQPANNDTLAVTFSMDAANGFKDGELRKIPVIQKGTKETIGNFWVLPTDTAFTFTPEKDGSIIVHAQNNTIDVLLDELKHLKDYPYYCMEQTASKIRGLLAEQKIKTSLKLPFTEEKLLQQLKRKLQEAQNFDGGWGWWKSGESNLYISTYITKALQPLKDDILMASAIRNAVLFLQNKLNTINRYQLLEVLYTLSETGHQMDYVSYLRKIPFDSISLHNQWQVVKIKQVQNLPYELELNKLMEQKTQTMLGGLHWGRDSYSWQNNAMATTTLAFQVLTNEKNKEQELGSILQYFLANRKNGSWRNTVESANITSVLLPYLLSKNAALMDKAVLQVNNNTYTQFPLTLSIAEKGNIDIKKSGGGMMYLTAWQQFFNKKPQAVTDRFAITSSFLKNGTTISHLQAGEKATMKVKVVVHADAEYVQLEIPIPAGCTYAEKKQNNWRVHKEFLKDRMVIFIEYMPKGEYDYEIELEPRYSGNYHLNPVKAELMYFPTFYGRNNMSDVNILTK